MCIYKMLGHFGNHQFHPHCHHHHDRGGVVVDRPTQIICISDISTIYSIYSTMGQCKYKMSFRTSSFMTIIMTIKTMIILIISTVINIAIIVILKELRPEIEQCAFEKCFVIFQFVYVSQQRWTLDTISCQK